MHEMDYTVTLTAKDLAFRERARAAGIPAMVVSMYAGALQRLVEDEREECAEVCDDEADDGTEGEWDSCCSILAKKIRARGEK
jgi:hypothetical protein